MWNTLYSKDCKSVLSTASQGWRLQIEKQWISESQWEGRQENRGLTVQWKKKGQQVDIIEATCGEWFGQVPAFKASTQRHMMGKTV